MQPGKNIDHIIASIVTRIALAFPVAYIQSISLFNGQKKIAVCNWDNIQNKGVFQFCDLLNGWSETTDHPINQTIVVDAIDMNGCLIKLRSPHASPFEFF
ncbi:MAG: hypothetical protein ACHQFW_01090 [Chitinophagales bacterium]